jgi:hypothetical protein
MTLNRRFLIAGALGSLGMRKVASALGVAKVKPTGLLATNICPLSMAMPSALVTPASVISYRKPDGSTGMIEFTGGLVTRIQ